jgi:two-component system, chemotaxis family, chemotaxis protein CheY
MEHKKPKVFPDLKVLIVEDVESVQKRMLQILNKIGLKKITCAKNGSDALALLQAENACDRPFNLVISDINMPKMSGLQLLKKIKNNPLLKSTSVFMVSARNEMESVMEAIDSGASNYLIKPFDEEKVREKIFEIYYKKN